MAAELFQILSRHRRSPIGLVDPGDFRCAPAGTADPSVVLRPEVSLYCLDAANRRALFVETDPGIELSAAPFYYQAQYENAKRVVALPFDEMLRLAAQVDDPGERLVLLYSTGRCGSTLLSRALGRVSGVLSLSEPDALTQVVGLRPTDGSADDHIQALAAACVKLQCKQRAGVAGATQRWALKFRSMVIEIADLLHRSFPRARSLFLYRDATAVVESSLRAFRDAPQPPDTNTPQGRELAGRYVSWLRGGAPRHLARAAAAVLRAASRGDWRLPVSLTRALARAARGGQPAMAPLLSVLWLSTVNRYLELHRAGVIPVAFRYETLAEHPQETLEAIFRHAGLPPESAAGVCTEVMARDSQEGSPVARDRARSNVQGDGQLSNLAETVRAIVAMHCEIATPAFIAPGTHLPGGGD